MTATPPKYVKQILMTLQKEDYRAFLVGGCVRDMFLERTPSDWDITTNALPDEIMAVFPDTLATGLKHGTVTVKVGRHRVEVTTMRLDGEYSDHRRPGSVAYISDLTADLARRDFTMNAIAISSDGFVIDPNSGVADIKKSLVRCVGDPETRFTEDALRMFRAIRFSAQLGFDIEENTAAAIYSSSHLAAIISAERIRDELEKILMSPKPERISRMLSFGLLDTFLLRPRASFDFARASSLPKNKMQRWAAFCCLLEQKKLISSTEIFLRRLRLDNNTIKSCSLGVRAALTNLPETVRDWKGILAEQGTNVALGAAAAAEMIKHGNYIKTLRILLRSGDCFSLSRLAVNGDDIMQFGLSGVEVGYALKTLLNHVLDHPKDNKKEILMAILTVILTEAKMRDSLSDNYS